MNCHIICSKFPPLADTHARSQLKLETLKTMGTPRKIDAILQPKLVSMCRYKLVTYLQNFTEIYLT